MDGTLPTAYVDRFFLNTKVDAPNVAGTGKTLFRFEFMEIMIRIANAKYRESGRVETYAEALEIMLD